MDLSSSTNGNLILSLLKIIFFSSKNFIVFGKSCLQYYTNINIESQEEMFGDTEFYAWDDGLQPAI